MWTSGRETGGGRFELVLRARISTNDVLQYSSAPVLEYKYSSITFDSFSTLLEGSPTPVTRDSEHDYQLIPV